MKKFKLFCIKFILYIYTQYIVEDWSLYTKVGKIVLYPAWFILSTLIWIISPVLISDYLFKQSKLYKEIDKIKNSPEFKAHMALTMKRFNMPNMPM